MYIHTYIAYIHIYIHGLHHCTEGLLEVATESWPE